MRLALASLLVVLAAAPAGAEITKQDCDTVGTMANTYVTLAGDARRALETQALAKLTADGSPELRAAGEKVEAARQAAARSAMQYAESLNELTHLLSVCTR